MMRGAPTAIAQISDLHIKPPGAKAYGVVDTARALSRCIDHLNLMSPPPDIVVISGDLVDTGSEAEYQHLEQLFAPLKSAVAVIPGNHDVRAHLRRLFPAQPYARQEGALDFALAVADLDLILLDSSVPGRPHGWLGTDTLAWLDETLGAAPERPAVLFLHHPPFRSGISHMDRQILLNADTLGTIVARHPRTRLVAAGHIHRAASTIFAGTPATICPALNHAVDLDLTAARVPSFTVEPPAFHLHLWMPDDRFGHLISHVVPVGRFEGPYPFFRTDGKLL